MHNATADQRAEVRFGYVSALCNAGMSQWSREAGELHVFINTDTVSLLVSVIRAGSSRLKGE